MCVSVCLSLIATVKVINKKSPLKESKLPSTNTFLNLHTLSLYSSSGTEECWKEVEKEEALESAAGTRAAIGAGVVAGTVVTDGKEAESCRGKLH